MKKIILAVLAFVAVFEMKVEASRTCDEYVDYLYGSMMPADSLDYPREFYERNVELSLEARETMPWGSIVPEREFCNFVLPVRVNNEHLDMAREMLYNSLKKRVAGMSMGEAALEVNHWLHERVTYRPSDSRTSTPLATLCTSFGRCGEESTLAVAAMRAVGIPARQVYTPRWAHTDDNHAWVEVWVDGAWHFLGACEPEPLLDLAWFNAPASRGMLMTTNALAGYDGPEEVLSTSRFFTQINVTSNYAPVAEAKVRVLNRLGEAVSGATVRFLLYNYAEFFTLATKVSDMSGMASLTAGYGDLLVWATAVDGATFGFAKCSVGRDDVVDVVMDKDASYADVVEYDLVPPRSGANLPEPTAAQRAENSRRFAVEDSIRNAYMATFFSAASASEYVEANHLPLEAAELLQLSYGNHKAITDFLAGAQNKKLAVRFLKSLSEKDLRDVDPSIIREFYHENLPNGVDTTTYIKYVMCPRVWNEHLSPYRSYFAQANIGYDNPEQWIEWIDRNIAINVRSTNRGVITSPEKVYEYRNGIDPLSRNVFAVASLRTMDVPAYLDGVTGRLHYINKEGLDCEVVFSDQRQGAALDIPAGELVLDYTPVGRIDDPGYYTHFSLATIVDGAPAQLNFDDITPWSTTFGKGMKVDAGLNLLVSGQRLASGSVLARLDFFHVEADAINHHPLVIRQSDTSVQVLGNFNSENVYHELALNEDKSILSTTGRGYYLIALIRANHEPTAHILNDISLQAQAFEQWGGTILLLFEDADEATRFNREAYPNLPKNVVFGSDIDGKISSEMAQFGTDRPVVLIADTFNRVVFISEGYTINIDQRLLNTLHQLQ